MGQILKWSKHLVNNLAISLVMGVLATLSVSSTSNDRTFFIPTLYHTPTSPFYFDFFEVEGLTFLKWKGGIRQFVIFH